LWPVLLKTVTDHQTDFSEAREIECGKIVKKHEDKRIRRGKEAEKLSSREVLELGSMAA